MRFTLRQVLSILLAAASANVNAQGQAKPATAYSSNPIRIVVTYPPGGPTDVVARVLGQKLTERWSQPVVIDDRAGAGGVVGTEVVARAAPDGYTLLLGTSARLAINPALSPKLPYDAFTDFAPVSLVSAAAPELPTIAEAGLPGFASARIKID
jgi:tripartite-type tricarboxylate transporter receptor subunit TctC